ncbi:MAG: hypothetical protein PHE78_07465 [Candidatus Gastranaerophilales bacterium]|nr:hypothetical protein [Candidatus Gastranaerophilales bacterium]
MITNFNPSVSRARINNKNTLAFEAKLTNKDIEVIKEGKAAGKLNTILGHIGAGYYTKEDNEGIMRQLTKDHGGSPIIHAINNAFGFKFPKK